MQTHYDGFDGVLHSMATEDRLEKAVRRRGGIGRASGMDGYSSRIIATNSEARDI